MNIQMNAIKYDSSLEERTTFYDKLPYERNWDVCGADSVKRFSGNIVKSFTCSEADTREVPNQEARLFAKLRRQEELNRLEEASDELEEGAEE